MNMLESGFEWRLGHKMIGIEAGNKKKHSTLVLMYSEM